MVFQDDHAAIAVEQPVTPEECSAEEQDPGAVGEPLPPAVFASLEH
jgi:hypothetical protein